MRPYSGCFSHDAASCFRERNWRAPEDSHWAFWRLDWLRIFRPAIRSNSIPKVAWCFTNRPIFGAPRKSLVDAQASRMPR